MTNGFAKNITRKDPYISVVLSFRNDEYQGESFKRFQVAIDALIYQAKHYNLNAELIIVEWNPPSDKPLLKDAISLPDDLGPLVIRIITVPHEIHKRYNLSKRISILCMIASNVGIRRANGQFILSTCSGILFSNKLVEFLASISLNKSFFYRIDRCNVNREILNCNSVEQQIDFCKENIIRIDKFFPPDPNLINYPTIHTNASGDFILMSKKYWHLLHGFPEFNKLGLHADGLLCFMAYLAGVQQKILQDPLRLYHIDHDCRREKHIKTENKFKSLLRSQIYDKIKYNKFGKLIKWVSIYIHILLESCTKISYSIFDLFLQKIFSHAHEFNMEYLYWKYKKILNSMLLKKRSYIFNDNNWGLPKEDFKETVFISNKQI